jgi:outer membrane protein
MKMFTNHGLFSRFGCLLAAGCLGMFFSTAAQAQEVITIKQAVARMLQNNINIRQSDLNVATANVNLTQSRAALFPTANASVSDNLSFGRSLDQTTFQIANQTLSVTNGQLGTSVDLFGGLVKMNQIKQNRVLLEANISALDKTKNDLVLQVVTSYFQVVFNEDLLRASREQLVVAQQTLERENELMNAGNKTMADISQAKAQVATAELNVTNAQNQLTISFLTLSQLMEMRADNNNYKVVAPTIEDINYAQQSYNVNDVFNESLKIYPDIKLARLNREASEIGVKVAKGYLYPTIALNAGIGSSYSYAFDSPDNIRFSEQINQRFNQYIGLSLQIPIFNGLTAKSGVKRAQIQYQGYINQELLIRNTLNKIIAQAIADLRAAGSRYVSTENTFNAQKDAFMVIEERYNVGLVNSLDYNTARTNRNRAEIDFIQAKYDLLFRSKVIDFYLGKEITF